MLESIKNPSLIPEWFITSGGKVTGIHDANGTVYEFVGSSEKGKDGLTPLLKINSANNYKWEVSYDGGTVWNEVQVSPAASGMVGPQGETGPSGNSIVLQSAEQVEGGIQVTLAWGENETSAFLIPSGTPGSSYTFDQTTSGDGSAEHPIGVNTDVIATKEDLDDYVKHDDLLPENGISGDYVSQDNKYHFGLATSGIDANKQYAWTTNGWQEVTAQGSIAAGTDLVLNNGVMKVNTNGVANSAGMAFVEGADTVASGAASHAEGKEVSAMSNYSHAEGYKNKDNKIAGLELPVGANHIEGAYNQTSGVYSHIEGHANTLYGYGIHMQGGYNEFYSHNLSADRSDPEGRWNVWGQSIEGMANKTTTEPVSGYDGNTPLYLHGGILKVIGNGTRTVDSQNKEHIDRSDALILYRDGSMWLQGPLTTDKVFVSGYNFDTFGQSRLDSNDVCYGTNWMGVSQSHAGFLKFIDGQNPGDTEIHASSSGIQFEFKPDRTQGELNVINTYAGTPTTTKVVNVPAGSYTNMSTFDSENGPNYMLRKTANGFDIGAAVINTTALPDTVQANAYYFIYEM